MLKVLYARYSDERDPAYSLYTRISEEDSHCRTVCKFAENPLAAAHLRHIEEAGNKLEFLYRESGAQLAVNRCRMRENCLELEYLEGDTLEKQMDTLLDLRGPEAVLAALKEFIETAVPVSQLQPFSVTDEFRQWFGDHSFPEGTMTLPVSDIDMICSNVICIRNRRVLIDYEWTFFFPVPVKFLIFRILYYYAAFGTKRQELNRDSIYADYGISEEDIRIFQEMEYGFQKRIQGKQLPLRVLYDRITPGTVHISQDLRKDPAGAARDFLQVFWSDGSGFGGEPEKYQMRDGRIDIEIVPPEGAVMARLDPGDFPCICKVQLLAFDGRAQDVSCLGTNGCRADDGIIVFDSIDPQIWFPLGEPRPDVLSVSLRIEKISGEMGAGISSRLERTAGALDTAGRIGKAASFIRQRMFGKQER